MALVRQEWRKGMIGRGKVVIVAAALFSSVPAEAQAIDADFIRAGIDELIDAVLALSSEAGSAASVQQTGFASRAFIAQTGPFNRADVSQAGIMITGIDLPNLAVIGQSGEMGRAEIDQAGTGNVAAINQVQSTQLAIARIDQRATFNNGATLQRGLGGFSQVTQSGGLFGIGAHVALVKQLDGSISIVAQQGSDHLVLVDQAGFGNQSEISQRDRGSDAGDEIILAAGAFQTGSDHISEIVQDADGAGAFASLVQIGNVNRSFVEQKASAETLVFQADLRNVSDIRQATGSAGSLANVDQLGSDGSSLVRQDAAAAKAIVLQDRDSIGALSEVLQDAGQGHEAIVIQAASAQSYISQSGVLNYAIVRQTGDGSLSTVRQTGSGNRAEVNQ
jgi:hypothetical protein